jgi:tetratricopeptide (TPR) repeat protein
MAAKTFGDLLSGVRRAIDREDWDAGEALLEHLEQEAEHVATPAALASAAFYAGMFYDAKGELARAEAAFGEAVSWDERAHGPTHKAVAHALRSLAMVQAARSKLQDSVATRRRAADVLLALDEPVLAAESLIAAGDALRHRGYYKSGLEVVAEALPLLRDNTSTAARAQRIDGYLVQAECLRACDVLDAAADRVILATMQGYAPDDARLRAGTAMAWDRLAALARLAWSDEGLAVLALAVARDVTPDDALRGELARAIAASPEAALGRARIEGYVVSQRMKNGEIQLVHPGDGLCYASDERAGGSELARGDRVKASLVDREAAVSHRITG